MLWRGSAQGFPRGEAVTTIGTSEPIVVTDEGCRVVIQDDCHCIRLMEVQTARHPSSVFLRVQVWPLRKPPSPRGKAFMVHPTSDR